MKVLLSASEIPAGSMVTKRTGNVEYQLLNEIVIYSEKGAKRTISADPETKFLVGSNGNVNAISGDTLLMWEVEPETLMHFLQDYLDGTPQ